MKHLSILGFFLLTVLSLTGQAQSTCGAVNGSNAKVEQLTSLMFFEIVNDQSQNLEILPVSSEFRNAAKIKVAPGESGFITVQIARLSANGSFFPQIVPNPYIDQSTAAKAGIQILKQDGNDPKDIVRQEFMFDLSDERIFANCALSTAPATFVFKASQLKSTMYFDSWVRK